MRGFPERNPNKPTEEQGLFRKYNVSRTDGLDMPGHKHNGCEYFVLDIDHDPAAIPALERYADAVERTHPKLAEDIRNHPKVQSAILARALESVLNKAQHLQQDYPTDYNFDAEQAILNNFNDRRTK